MFTIFEFVFVLRKTRTNSKAVKKQGQTKQIYISTIEETALSLCAKNKKERSNFMTNDAIAKTKDKETTKEEIEKLK